MSRFKSLSMVLVAAFAGVALIAACSGGSSAEKPAAATSPAASGGASSGGAAAGGSVKATLEEFTIDLAPAAVKAGSVKVDATNSGALAHELIIVKTDLAPDKLPVKDGIVDMSGLKASGTIETFDAGKSSSKTFNLEPGKYVVFCNIAGHYVGGMHTALTVN